MMLLSADIANQYITVDKSWIDFYNKTEMAVCCVLKAKMLNTVKWVVTIEQRIFQAEQ